MFDGARDGVVPAIRQYQRPFGSPLQPNRGDVGSAAMLDIEDDVVRRPIGPSASPMSLSSPFAAAHTGGTLIERAASRVRNPVHSIDESALAGLPRRRRLEMRMRRSKIIMAAIATLLVGAQVDFGGPGVGLGWSATQAAPLDIPVNAWVRRTGPTYPLGPQGNIKHIKMADPVPGCRTVW